MIGSSFAPFAAWVLMHGVMLAPQGRSALYFEKVPVKTSSERTCMRFAGDVSRDRRFTNGHASGSEVAGELNGAYVAITCVGRGNQPALPVSHRLLYVIEGLAQRDERLLLAKCHISRA